ncbi:matrixin family metalloprotease [Candidatus Curtissbacteria bacterium]|nr:matrixin family metalloprotease [Candidatus Curtissbacteria bacterium]
MKKILLFLLLVSIIILGAVFYSQGFITFSDFLSKSACDKPLGFRIGTIDARFNLSEDQLISRLGEAEAIWEKPTGRDLFTYDSTAKLTVNMIYDRRQSLHNQISELENQLARDKGDLEARRAEFEKLARDFERRLELSNSEVASWNSQGGAPPEVYDSLIKRQDELAVDADRLNKLASDLNLETREYNTGVGQLNQTISAFNENLSRKPEEGLFDPLTSTIEIYFVVSDRELTHTIAHELGHARGLSHIARADSMMFAFSTEVVALSPADIAAVTFICREIGPFEVIKDKLKLEL